MKNGNPKQEDVNRKFCKQFCNAWRGTWCGTVYALKEKKDVCLWTMKEIKKKMKEHRIQNGT
uniref:Uncharacterized protein n=1 Tax=viral metagenome TaxID=1070528 RepID=A0A6M3L2V0_9ZZZZ